MNEYLVGQLIAQYFGASAMTIGALVFAFLLMLLLYITIRDHILNFEEKSNDVPRRQPPGD